MKYTIPTFIKSKEITVTNFKDFAPEELIAECNKYESYKYVLEDSKSGVEYALCYDGKFILIYSLMDNCGCNTVLQFCSTYFTNLVMYGFNYYSLNQDQIQELIIKSNNNILNNNNIKEVIFYKKSKIFNIITEQIETDNKMNIQDVARLNAIMNEMTMKSLNQEQILNFINVKEQLEKEIEFYRGAANKIVKMFNIEVNEEGQAISGDDAGAQVALKKLFQSYKHSIDGFLEVDEFVSMIGETAVGGDISFAKKYLVKE